MPAAVQQADAELDLELHPKQELAFNSEATEILYGGAAGGGKSHLLRAAAILWCAAIPGLQVYLFRRKLPDLIKNHIDGPHGFPALLAPWTKAGFVVITSTEIRFWNGAKIHLCHCKDEKHRFNYHGAEIHVLLVDELTHFSDRIYRYLRGRVRAVGLGKLPPEFAGRFPRILACSNPGNIGHQYVKAAFIDPRAPFEIEWASDDEGGMLRQFVPSKLADNPHMEADDPEYRQRLRGMGTALARALEEGDWNVVEGAYFDGWNQAMVIRPFKWPDHWFKLRSFDWGSARPWSHGWWVVASEPCIHPGGFVIPKGAMIRVAELYGGDADKPNTGWKWKIGRVAAAIKERAPFPREDDAVADPAIFAEDGGPSIAEQLREHGVDFRRADNSRAPGWEQLRDRMVGEDGRPMIYCFDTCAHSIRTIPALQHDEARPEDLNSDQEDHCADEWRYAAMSRPYTRPKPAAPRADDRIDRAFRERRGGGNNWKLA